MPTYLTPGVYIEELPASTRPIEAIGTSTAVFIGFTREGPLGTPELVTKWDHFVDRYGGISTRFPGDPLAQSVAAFFLNGGGRAYIVRVAEGATPATGVLLHPDADPDNPSLTDQLVRFTAANPGSWGGDVAVELTPRGDGGRYTLRVLRERASPGAAPVEVEIERFDDLSLEQVDPRSLATMLASASSFVRADLENAGRYMFGTSESEPIPDSFEATALNGKSLAVAVDGTSRPVTFEDDAFDAAATLEAVAAEIQAQVRKTVSVNAAVREFTATVEERVLRLRSGLAGANSRVVVAAGDDAAEALHLGVGNGGTERTGVQALARVLAGAGPVRVALAGGTDGTAPASATAYEPVFANLLKVRDINIVCLPGRTWTPGDAGNADRGIIDHAISHARTAQRRMVIVDPPLGAELTTDGDVADLGLPTSPYAAIYYPWLHVANPAYNPETAPTQPPTVPVPPCGFAAGTWASIDGRRGVWKAPAGTEAALLGVARLDQVVEDAEQESLNPAGVNAIRRFPGYGTVVWGSRTLATRADPQWRYTSIRRTAMLIEGSVFAGIQWAVFEPNDEQLWASLRTNITSFMDGLFRAGAFQGSQASKAYFVACGLGSTMTQDDIDRGQVIVQVGFAPLKLAEFVIVRIQQQVGQQ